MQRALSHSTRGLTYRILMLAAFILIMGAQARALTLALTESDTSPKYGRVDVTLTATITPWSSGYNGTLYFYDNNLEIGEVVITTGASGVTSITIPNVYAGAHTFKAHYVGSNGGNPSGAYYKTFTQNILAPPPSGSVSIRIIELCIPDGMITVGGRTIQCYLVKAETIDGQSTWNSRTVLI